MKALTERSFKMIFLFSFVFRCDEDSVGGVKLLPNALKQGYTKRGKMVKAEQEEVEKAQDKTPQRENGPQVEKLDLLFCGWMVVLLIVCLFHTYTWLAAG